MNQLEITFGLFLYDYTVDDLSRKGPLFHRWLPDGRNDALKVIFPDDNAYVLLWFERRGYVDNSGFIKHDNKRKEVDESVIPRQAVLDGGALYGAVVLEDVKDQEYRSVIDNKIGDAAYVSIGKRVVKKYVDPLVMKIARIIRDTYGQYWIDIPRSFDSREASLGLHCSHLAMKWHTSDGNEGSFLPNEKNVQTLHFEVTASSYKEYLDEKTWKKMGSLLESGYEPSTAVSIASRANRLLDENRISHALIEVVISLEVALEEYVRIKLNHNANFTSMTQSFWQLPLTARMTLVASLANAEADDISNSIQAISERNRIVHDGCMPAHDATTYIEGLLRLIKVLADLPKIKLPSANHSNELRKSTASWES